MIYSWFNLIIYYLFFDLDNNYQYRIKGYFIITFKGNVNYYLYLFLHYNSIYSINPNNLNIGKFDHIYTTKIYSLNWFLNNYKLGIW